MTYEQYWYDDPLMVRAFYKAEKLRQEREDYSAWLQGLYVLNALNATVGNIGRKDGEEPIEYPKEPFYVLDKKKREEEKREKTEREQEQEATWAMAWMHSFVQAGKKWGKTQ